MAADKQTNQEQATQDQNITQRIALNDAYAALLGQQSVQSFSAFTFEEALDAQIEQIEGAGTEKRPNQLGRVDRIESGALQAIDVLKRTPPEQFAEPDDEEDVNTEQ